MQTICRLCGVAVDPEPGEPTDACPDCVEAEADDMLFCETLREAGFNPMGRNRNVDDGAV